MCNYFGCAPPQTVIMRWSKRWVKHVVHPPELYRTLTLRCDSMQFEPRFFINKQAEICRADNPANLLCQQLAAFSLIAYHHLIKSNVASIPILGFTHGTLKSTKTAPVILIGDIGDLIKKLQQYP